MRSITAFVGSVAFMVSFSTFVPGFDAPKGDVPKDETPKDEKKAPAPAETKKANDEALIKILKGADDAAAAAKKAVEEAAREVTKAAEGTADAVKSEKAEPAAKDAEKKDEKKDEKKSDKKDDGAAAKKEEKAKESTAKKEEKKDEKKEEKKDAAVEVKLDDAPPAVAEKAGPDKKDEKKDKAEATAEKKPAGPPKKKPLEAPMFRLRDGTRLAGVPELKSLNIKTAYGKLVVPIAEVVKMRFAASEDTQIATKVQATIQSLGSEEFDKREEAMAALRDIGAPALDALKKAAESEDEEVKTRAEKLVTEIEETLEEVEGEDAALGAVQGVEDEIVTVKFTVRGRVEEESFALGTRYGALKLSRNDIVSVLFQDSPTSKVTIPVPGVTFAAANKWVDTKITLAQGERLHITASGQISLENYGQTTGPEGTTNISGNQLETHPTGALVGKIGDKGKPFLIGADFEGAANAAGNLQLGVSLQNGNVGGQYQVEIEREAES